jgi:hypothetical protein
MICSSLVIRSSFKVFEEIRFKSVSAHEISGDNAEETPPSLTRIRIRRFVVGRLLHDLAVHFIPQRLMFVAVLKHQDIH